MPPPKYAARLKFPKTPFSHLWSALQCALCILEIVFSFLHSECFFLQIASILSWTKWSETKFVLLWLLNSSSSLLRRQATRIWCSIRSGCWPETFATDVFSPPQCSESFSLSLLISSPFHDEAEDSHQPYYDSTPSTLFSLFNKKVGAPWRWWISFWLIQAQKWWKSRHAWQTKIWWPACRNCPDNLKTVWTRVWRIYSNIRIFEYIGHEYIFGHSFISIFLLWIYLDIRSCQICLYEYIRTFVGECVRV